MAKTPCGRKSHCWKAHFFKISFFVKYFRQRLLSNTGLHAAIIRLSPLIHEGEQRVSSLCDHILGDPGAVSRTGLKGATKVFKHGRKSPWVSTLTGPFPNGQKNAGSWLGTKNALYYCAQSANSFSWVLFASSYTKPEYNNQSIIPSTDVIQLTLTLKMTTAQVVETSVTVNNNSPIQDYVHPDD